MKDIIAGQAKENLIIAGELFGKGQESKPFLISGKAIEQPTLIEIPDNTNWSQIVTSNFA